MDVEDKHPKRFFINNVDSYASKYIAKFFSEYIPGELADADGENQDTAERMNSPNNGAKVFQTVGTVSGISDENTQYVLEQYFQLTRDELLSKMMNCDVIIYNITQHIDQVEEALWAVSALHNKIEHFSQPKMFLLISTVMTWASSKPFYDEELQLPFIEENYWTRRPHPNFTQHCNLEKKVVKMGKTNRGLFSTYVIASGLQYGMGEQIFHYFFKTSWLGQEEIPVFGNGNNIVPTIHINDLASVIQNVIQHEPKQYYILAVDNSNNTLEDIVKAVASALGPGKIQKRPWEEALLIKDFNVMELDSILVNIYMKGVLINDLSSVSWVCESGLVDNISLVVEEYRQTRGLQPIQVCVLGPPAVGKSTVAREICKLYKLHHITVKETISETIAQLNDVVGDCDPAAENRESIEEAQELLKKIKDSMKQNEGVLDDDLLVKVMKDKIISNPCMNQGYVLDGFPKTHEQAKQLFPGEEDEADDGPSLSKKVIPEFVLCLNASDSFLKDRVINLPESFVQEHNYEYEIYLQRLAKYREKQAEENVVDYFEELKISPLHLEITSNDEPDCLLLMKKITHTVGKPKGYSPSILEVQEEERRKAEENVRRENQKRAQDEQREKEEAVQRAALWEEWTRGLEREKQREEELLETETTSIRNYLLEQVMPVLNCGLIECCTLQPQDPVDFLAEFLLRNNPANN